MRGEGFIIFFLFLGYLSFATSAGCCTIDSENSFFCAKGVDNSYCESLNGNYFDKDLKCDSQRDCDEGCCVLGLKAQRTTRGDCGKITEKEGFSSLIFFQSNEDCSRFISSQNLGACVGKNVYGRTSCKFVSETQCVGSFYPGTLCSSIQDSECYKTEDKACFGNDIYYLDRCGNRDSLVQTCDYSSGKVCTEIISTGVRSATCENSACIDNFDYSEFILQDYYLNSPSFQQTTKVPGDAWCVTNGNVPFSEGELERDLNKFENTISTVAGLKFFSKSCVGGQIVTEACSDGKEGYCSGSGNVLDTLFSGTGGRCTSNEWRDCLSSENEEDCNTRNCFWFSPEIIFSGHELIKPSSLEPGQTDRFKKIDFWKSLEELEISMCLPKIPGGSSGDISSSSVCSTGDFTTSFDTGEFVLVKSPKNEFVLLDPMAIAALEYRCSRISDCTSKANWVGSSGVTLSNNIEYLTADEIFNQIESREISFKSGKNSGKDMKELLNFFLNGTNFSSLEYLEEVNFNDYVTDKFPVVFAQENSEFEFKCLPRRATTDGDCSRCNEEGMFCTKYSCEALGRNCEFMSSGTCESKADLNPPVVTLNCPDSSSINIQNPSYTITATTSETALCRFEIGGPKSNFLSMSYELGNIWGKEHETVLTIPGENKASSKGVTYYPLLNRAGKFEVYVRCKDPRGNGETEAPMACSFEAPKIPDKNPPQILKFNPATNFPIKYNTTEKLVEIIVNEPSECKWSLKNIDYDSMENEFECNRVLQIFPDISGYSCKSNLKGITSVIGESTRFYLRCKDQPNLVSVEKIKEFLREDGYQENTIEKIVTRQYSEDYIINVMKTDGYDNDEISAFLDMYRDMEDLDYSRNVNDRSFEYLLRPSEKLEIVDVSPRKDIVLGPNSPDWSLTVDTKGGGYKGITDCKWKINALGQESSFSSFPTSQSTHKSQQSDLKHPGTYNVTIICKDDSENEVIHSELLKITLDTSPPVISRAYNDKGSLLVFTSEPAVCKFTTLISLGRNCAFTFNHPNLSIMDNRNSLAHTAQWNKATSYFVKCEDQFGNVNQLCGVAVKTI